MSCDKDNLNINKPTVRENFLMSVLQKLASEYKALLAYTRGIKPFKIVEISQLSSIPGETKFIIQITNKHTILTLSAAEIISKNFNLNDFSQFHATLIRQAACGKLIDFLNLSEKEPAYTVVSKKVDPTSKQFIFTIETRDKVRFNRSAEDLSKDKNLLENMDIRDIYDIGYTQGSEQIIKEKTALLLAKHK
ncbi:MAG: hypothetical protein ABI597_00780 [Gammaproteobacteria bacterium]